MKPFIRQLTVPIILTLSGLLFFAIGAGLTMRQRSLEKQGMEAPGVVVALHENYDSDGSTYKPVVQFHTPGGQKVEFTSSYSSNPPAYEIGERVTVVYNPDEPSKAVIKGEGQILHIIFMLVGGIDSTIGFTLLLVAFRNKMVSEPGEL